ATDPPAMSARLRALLSRPVDAAGLCAFRAAFGLLMFAGTLRFAARGWISAMYVEPTFHFHYWGLAWVRPLPHAGMLAVFAAIAALSLLVAVGLWYRAA